MVEVLDKIIERLKEASFGVVVDDGYDEYCDECDPESADCVLLSEAIEIVNQAKDVVLEKECSEWCQDCKEYDKEKHHCPRFRKVILETIEENKEALVDKWVPCSVRLPNEDGKEYIVQKANGLICVLGFTKGAYKLDKYDFCEYKGKRKSIFYEYDSEYGYIECTCVAWQPLPEPYKTKGEQ